MSYVADNFQRANGSIGPNWTTPTVPDSYASLSPNASIQLINHAFSSILPNGGQAQSTWNAGHTFADDQWAQAQVVAPGVNTSAVSITACVSISGTSTYTYSLTSGSPLIMNQQIYISGMQHSGNNSTVGFIITALGAGTFSVANASPGANEAGSTGTGTSPSDHDLILSVRSTLDGQNGYFCYVGTNSGYIGNEGTSVDQREYTYEIWKSVSGVLTALTEVFPFPTTINSSIGDSIRLAVQGTVITLYVNEVSILSTTDSSLTSGLPGIGVWGVSGAGEWVTPTVYTGANSGYTDIQWTDFAASDDSPVIADNFVRTPGTLGANWTTSTGASAPQISSSGVVEGTVLDVNNAAYYSAATFPADQFSEVVFGVLGNQFSYLGSIVRASTNNRYALEANVGNGAAGNSKLILVKIVAGSQSALTTYTVGSEVTTGLTITTGALIRLVVSGTTVSAYLNGTLVIQATDASLSSGYPGLVVQADNLETNATITGWKGGSATVSTPTFTPVAGSYGPAQTVSIAVDPNQSIPGVSVYYTTDGSTPTSGSTLYTTPITISTTTTLNAIAIAAGYTSSAVATALYTIDGAVGTPTFSPVAGSYGLVQSVTISAANSTSIYYTTDGSTPTTGSTLYSGPVSVGVTETLKAIGVAAGYSNSAVGSASYTITLGTFSISGFVLGTIPYEKGTIIPPVSANLIKWTPSPAHFGNLITLPHTFGNPVQWTPSPAHFGNKLPGGSVTVTLSGAASATTTTDELGGYTFSNLAAGTYTVTPSKAGYAFAPISQTITINDSVNGIDFGSV